MPYPHAVPNQIKAAIMERWVENGYRTMYPIAKEFNVSPDVVSRVIDLMLYRTIDNPIVLVRESKV